MSLAYISEGRMSDYDEVLRLLRLIRDAVDREGATGYTLPWLLSAERTGAAYAVKRKPPLGRIVRVSDRLP